MIVYTPDMFLEGFSLSHVGIIDLSPGGTSRDEIELYGARSASIQASVEISEEYSNSVAIGAWATVSTLDIQVEAGYVSMELISQMLGDLRPPTTGIAPDSVKQSVPLHPRGSQRLGNVGMVFRMPARDAHGSPMSMEFVLYRVRVFPVEFGDMSYKEGMSVSYTAKAFLSDRDEQGQLLDRPAFGRLLVSGTNDPMAGTYVAPDNMRYDEPLSPLYGP